MNARDVIRPFAQPVATTRYPMNTADEDKPEKDKLTVEVTMGDWLRACVFVGNMDVEYLRTMPERLRPSEEFLAQLEAPSKRLADRQVIPPAKHLVKARARLERLNALIPNPEDIALGRKQGNPFAGEEGPTRRKQYAAELALVLRDYERMLDGLLPEEPQEPTRGHINRVAAAVEAIFDNRRTSVERHGDDWFFEIEGDAGNDEDWRQLVEVQGALEDEDIGGLHVVLASLPEGQP